MTFLHHPKQSPILYVPPHGLTGTFISAIIAITLEAKSHLVDLSDTAEYSLKPVQLANGRKGTRFINNPGCTQYTV